MEFENYNRTSQDYDSTRVAIGTEIILGNLAMNKRPLAEQSLLDAGCGTGNYIEQLKDRVGALTGIEQNTGMFEQARNKFSTQPTIQIDQGSITELPYPDESFDGVICNQVLHHLDIRPDHGTPLTENLSPHPRVQGFIREAFRVLRPQGSLIINTSSHEQQRRGFWWAALIPDAIEQVILRFPPIELLTESCRTSGFSETGLAIPIHGILQGRVYLDPEGPLNPEWRAGDSTWALASETELSEALDRVERMNRDGSITDFINKSEYTRKQIGQTSFLYAQKP